MKKLLLPPMFLAIVSAQDSLPIRLYNRAGVPPHVLDSAIREASRVLARAGVETVWTEGPPDALEGCSFDFSGRSPIQHPKPDTRGYLVVSVGRGGPASAFRDTFGFALPDASTGVHAFIFYDRLEQLTDPRLVTVPKLLAMAHELGHVLMGSIEHSSTGLMKARWDKADYLRAEAGMTQFSASEIEIMRERSRMRISISICNLANLPESVVSHGMAQAKYVFRSAEVEVRWRSCDEPPAGPEIPSFVIRLRSEKPPNSTKLASFDAMGRAFVSQGGTGYMADIYFESIRDFAKLNEWKADILLGYAIGHEIGHLLGVGHKGGGVMRGVWGVDDVETQLQGGMKFSRQDAERIRNQVRAIAARRLPIGSGRSEGVVESKRFQELP